MNKKYLFSGACLALLIAGITFPACAKVNTVQATPARQTIHDERPITFNIVWRVRGSGATSPVTVDLDDGNLYLGRDQTGTYLETISSGDTKTVSANAAGFYETTFTETVTISRAQIRQAIDAGQSLAYARQFSDDGFTTNRFGVVRIDLAGGIGGQLTVTRLRIGFDKGETVCSRPAGGDLKAQVYLQTEGSGMLRGEWQYRTDPYASSFRLLRNVRMPVNAGRDVQLRSPSLPTDTSGRVDVRFVVTEPDVAFEEPYVTCMIKGVEKDLVKHDLPGVDVNVVAPAAYAPLTPQTVIKWKPGTFKSYRIYFLRKLDGVPVAAQDVPASKTESKISAITFQKLDPNQRYLVRVMGSN